MRQNPMRQIVGRLQPESPLRRVDAARRRSVPGESGSRREVPREGGEGGSPHPTHPETIQRGSKMLEGCL